VTRFAANIGFLFRDRPWMDRFDAAREAGFEAVEFAWPPAPSAEVVAAVRSAGLRVALLNMAAGDLEAGDRGHPNDPAARDRWRDDLDRALELAGAVGCPAVNVLAGNRLADVPVRAQLDALDEQLGWALPRAGSAGVTLVVELLNPIDTPRYLVSDLQSADRLMDRFGTQGLRLQFDTYHVGQVTPDVAAAFTRRAGVVRHVQIADLPGRHEPGTGGLPWSAIFAAFDAVGYEGAVGLEYQPSDASVGLGWLARADRAWSNRPYRDAAPR
jgi:hydroxypyruvate isomerase